MDLPFHPVASVFPLLEGNEFAALVASVKKHGQRHPIITWTDPQGQRWVIDGRNRFRACQKAGIEPRLEEWDGAGSLVGMVIALNLDRRHLTVSQRAMVAAALLPFLQEEARVREHAGKKTLDANASRVGKTVDVAGALLGISGDSVQRAKAVQAKGSEQLQAAVRDGKVSVGKAKDIAELPAEEQAAAINQAERGSRERRLQDARRERIDQGERLLNRARKVYAGLGGEADALLAALEPVFVESERLREAG